jgi:hypothetical protein
VVENASVRLYYAHSLRAFVFVNQPSTRFVGDEVCEAFEEEDSEAKLVAELKFNYKWAKKRDSKD